MVVLNKFRTLSVACAALTAAAFESGVAALQLQAEVVKNKGKRDTSAGVPVALPASTNVAALEEAFAAVPSLQNTLPGSSTSTTDLPMGVAVLTPADGAATAVPVATAMMPFAQAEDDLLPMGGEVLPKVVATSASVPVAAVPVQDPKKDGKADATADSRNKDPEFAAPAPATLLQRATTRARAALAARSAARMERRRELATRNAAQMERRRGAARELTAARKTKDKERAGALVAANGGATEPRYWRSGEAGSEAITFWAHKQRHQWGETAFQNTYHLVDRDNGVFDVFRASSVSRYDSPTHMVKNEFVGSVVAFRELPEVTRYRHGNGLHGGAYEVEQHKQLWLCLVVPEKRVDHFKPKWSSTLREWSHHGGVTRRKIQKEGSTSTHPVITRNLYVYDHLSSSGTMTDLRAKLGSKEGETGTEENSWKQVAGSKWRLH